MIKDELEYKVTQEWVEKFEQSIAALEQDETKKKNDPSGWELLRADLQSQLDGLNSEVAEYERLITSDPQSRIKIQVNSLVELPKALIKARIAAQMSQKELADRLGIEEQQVQQYEATDYQCASFVEIIDVSEALAVELETGIFVVDFEEIERRKVVLAEFLERQRSKLPS